MRDAGIALVLHSQQHIEQKAPTGRIFEAASSGCVIISDRHPFVVNEFADSVLYIDDTQMADGLFQQINTHMQWISSHPQETEKMAQRAHSIFSKKFTLERQLQNLILM